MSEKYPPMSTASPAHPLHTYFADLEDPRIDRTKQHPLLSMVAVALCAVLRGADSWVEVAEYGEAQEAWFAQWLSLPHEIPSHDTFGWVFAALDPVHFELCWLPHVSLLCVRVLNARDGYTPGLSEQTIAAGRPIT